MIGGNIRAWMQAISLLQSSSCMVTRQAFGCNIQPCICLSCSNRFNIVCLYWQEFDGETMNVIFNRKGGTQFNWLHTRASNNTAGRAVLGSIKRFHLFNINTVLGALRGDPHYPKPSIRNEFAWRIWLCNRLAESDKWCRWSSQASWSTSSTVRAVWYGKPAFEFLIRPFYNFQALTKSDVFVILVHER